MCTACPQHFPHPLAFWQNVVIFFAQKHLFCPPSLLLFLAGLKTCLNHRGSLIMLKYQGMLSWGRWWLFLKVVFLFSIPIFCPCAMLVLKVLRSSQRELLGNGLFYLQKFIACIKLLYAILLSCLCQYTPTVYEICFSFSLPPPSRRVSYFSFSAATCTVVCSFLIFTYCLPCLRATEILVLFINCLKNCS